MILFCGLLGTVFRLKGGILSVSFLDSNGILIPNGTEPWRDLNREDPTKERKIYTSMNKMHILNTTKQTQMHWGVYLHGAI